jgi:uncharacterized membrane protein YeiH
LSIVYLLDLFGVFVFAVSGSLSAGRKRLDVFGVLIIALVTALGGGTLRDLVLGNTPVLWVREPVYLWVVMAGVLATLLGARWMRSVGKVLLYADALGLAVFTAIGVQLACNHGVDPLVAVLLGVMTGTFGGMIRDVLTNDIPLLLQKEIYALAALVGAAIYVAIWVWLGLPDLALWLAVAVTLLVRVIAIRWRLHLPLFEWDS